MIKRWLASRWALPVIGLVIGLTAVLLLSLALQDVLFPHRFAGTLMQSPQPVADFTLTGPDNKPVRLSDFQGKYVLLFFGYTRCPDVCPATLTEMNRAFTRLGGQANRVQVVFVSVDPEIDSAEFLQRYLAIINPQFIGLTGALDKIEAIATLNGIYFQKRKTNDQGGYLVDHTATVMLLDEKGYLRLVYPFGTAGDEIASDIQYLLKR